MVVQNFYFKLPGTVIEQRTSKFRIIVHVTIFIANCCVCDDALYIHCIIIVVNCGLLRNNLVKLVKFLFRFLIATIFGE